MKKGLGLLLLAVLLVTGCSKKKDKVLNCSYTLEDEKVKSTVQFEVTFDGNENKASSYIQRMIDEFKEIKDEDLTKNYEISLNECDELKNKKGTSCKVEKENKTITSILEVKIDELDEQTKEEFLIEEMFYMDNSKNRGYEEFKSLMEKTGYTCTEEN